MKNLILFFILALPFCTKAQEPSSTQATIQPTIMVIPFAKENEDLRRVLDAEPTRRIALTKVKEAFDNRGFSTIDFVAKLKETETRQVFTSDNLTDIKTQIIEYSGADIYVETEASMKRGSSGNWVDLIITAYDASTGTSIANKVGFSPKFHTDDFGRLAAKAVDEVIEDFLNVMQAKFTEIVENGKFVAVEFGVDPGSDLRMSTEIPGEDLPLADVLELWMSDNAFNGYYHIQGTSDAKQLFDQVRIPHKADNGAPYSSNKFALEIFKYCRKLEKPSGEKVGVKKEIKGNTIFITLN
jgi:hypothetical protein